MLIIILNIGSQSDLSFQNLIFALTLSNIAIYVKLLSSSSKAEIKKYLPKNRKTKQINLIINKIISKNFNKFLKIFFNFLI